MDMPITLTIGTVTTGLWALVDEYGEDHVYQPHGMLTACLYVHEGKPDCIVGKFLHAQGVPLERLERADQGPAKGAWDLLDELEEEGLVETDRVVREVLANVQGLQDQRCKWGTAVRHALEIH